MPTKGRAAVTHRTATLAGCLAIGLWAALAALTILAGPIPPFQLAGMTFAVGSLVGLAWALATRTPMVALLRVPAGALALGVYGLFAFHACYFAALQLAPALEASLIVYLWPLLIVLMSPLLPARLGGARLPWRSIGGAALGLAGAGLLIVAGKPGTALGQGSALGYLLSLGAALIWSSYSVASRLFVAVPTSSVATSCAITAVLSFAAHALLETTVAPAGAQAWMAIGMLGLGPVGLAFFLWDVGMKRGEIGLLGVLAYATPLVSTVLLAALGLGTTTRATWIAAVLIAGGGLLAGTAKRG